MRGRVDRGLGGRLRKAKDAGRRDRTAGSYLRRLMCEALEDRRMLASGLFDSLPEHSSVLARHVFYNHSSFDGYDPLGSAADDAAIALDKTPLLSWQTAGFANYTSYDKGVNAIIVDIAELPVASLTAADFRFLVGNGNDLANWTPAPAPQSIDVLPGLGQDGSDRVKIIWPDGAIKNQWLRVLVKSNGNTHLLEDDVFYFGNAVGESGNAQGNAIVNATDEIMARNFQHGALNPAAIDDAYDYNRDGLVNGTDQIIARNNQTNPLSMLRSITAPTALNELIKNGGFEIGDFTDWTATSDGLPKMDDWAVGPAGGGFFFDSSPYSGKYSVYNGFDGPTGHQYTLAQDVAIPADVASATLVTHHRIRYGAGNEPTQTRVFRIEVSDPAGQWTDVLYEQQIQITPAGMDFGWNRREFDLSAHAGQTVRIRFTAIIPESYTGRAILELDDISLTYTAAQPYIIHRRLYANNLNDDVGRINATLARSSIAFLPDSINATDMVEYAANTPRFATLKEASPSDGVIVTDEAIMGGGTDSMEVWISVGGYVYAIGATTDDIYRSATGEAPWTRMQTGTFSLLATMPDDSILVIDSSKSSTQKVFRSTDGGATLVRAKLSGVDMTATTNTTIEFWGPHVGSNGTVIMAEYANAVSAPAESVSAYRSVDNGANWTKVLTKDTRGADLEITHFHSPGYHAATGKWLLSNGDGTYRGLWESNDDGITWHYFSAWAAAPDQRPFQPVGFYDFGDPTRILAASDSVGQVEMLDVVDGSLYSLYKDVDLRATAGYYFLITKIGDLYYASNYPTHAYPRYPNIIVSDDLVTWTQWHQFSFPVSGQGVSALFVHNNETALSELTDYVRQPMP